MSLLQKGVRFLPIWRVQPVSFKLNNIHNQQKQPQTVSNVFWVHYRFNSNETNANYDNEAISKMIKSDKIVIFMKGVPEAPRCGFSNAVVQVLRMHGAPFQAHNVLDSDELRKAIKDFTSWPTIPQIFLDGEFIGGCDILLEKHQNGELIEDLKKIGIKSQILKDMENPSSKK